MARVPTLEELAAEVDALKESVRDLREKRQEDKGSFAEIRSAVRQHHRDHRAAGQDLRGWRETSGLPPDVDPETPVEPAPGPPVDPGPVTPETPVEPAQPGKRTV